MSEQTITGRKVVELTLEEKEQVLAAILRDQARERYPDVGRVKTAGRSSEFIADADGHLYEAVRIDGMPRPEHGVVAFAETSGGAVLWLRRPPVGSPQSISDLEQSRRELRKQRQKATEAEAKALAKAPRSAVTFAELHGVINAPSLRRAAEIVEAAAGELELHAGELIITLPSRGLQRTEALGAVRVLMAAKQTVVEAMNGKGKGLLSERLPDAPVRADGGVGG